MAVQVQLQVGQLVQVGAVLSDIRVRTNSSLLARIIVSCCPQLVFHKGALPSWFCTEAKRSDDVLVGEVMCESSFAQTSKGFAGPLQSCRSVGPAPSMRPRGQR